MKIFKRSINTCTILLGISILINIFLSIIVYIEESRSHIFGEALERRDLITLTDPLSDYYARKGWENTIRKMYTEFDVAFFGASIIRGSDFQKYFPDKKIINLLF